MCVCVHRLKEEAVNYCDRESRNACHVSPQVTLTIEGDLHEGYDGVIRLIRWKEMIMP